MKKLILSLLFSNFILLLSAQNMVVNPGAELLPRGTGWTIISQGPDPCIFLPTDTYLNWTIIPNGTDNYPYDHTTGAAGGTVFYAGCTQTYFSGPYELQQTINVSADATTIDLGTQLYTFSGYIQTPVDNQTDEGRFIVDYLNAANVILGTSYTTSWQSYFGGSGTAWTFYTNTRVAPATTRSIRIRLQAKIDFNRPAVNVYFDDISLTKPSVVPVQLLGFTAHENAGIVRLNWKVDSEINLDRYELEQSTDGISFHRIGTLAPGQPEYNFLDNISAIATAKIYYRLKMIDVDGKFTYSYIIQHKVKGRSITISPNPASDWIKITGTTTKGTVSIYNSSAVEVIKAVPVSFTTNINVSILPAGVYFIRYTVGDETVVKKIIKSK